MDDVVPAAGDVDAIVIGAGFSGLFATWRLLDLGLAVRSFDANDEIGGVWAWNRYPGAQTDSPHHAYRFTFDDELRMDWRYSRKFPPGTEVLAYLNHVADRFDLRRHYTLGTRVASAVFDERSQRWSVTTSGGEVVTAQYLVTGLGLVSAPILPSYPGLDTFQGTILYTSRWPREGVDLKGKRIALIGTGSSGCQISAHLAAESSALTVYLRTPNYVAPTGNRDVTDEDQSLLTAEHYPEIARKIRAHPASFPFDLKVNRLAVEASEQEREAIFEQMWERGGFSPLYETFDDVATDPVANEMLSEFFRKKIRQIVQDPERARILSPTYPYGAKRPPTGDAFYQAFNEPHVDLVDLKATPITEVTAHGITTGGVTREFDVIVMATGFDASTGAFTAMNIVGRDGVELKDHWVDGPRTYGGVAIHHFPNLFMVAGPQSPFSNLPPGAEFVGNWVGDVIEYMRANGIDAMEATAEAEQAWVDLCEKLGASSFTLVAAKEVNSWFTGANIEGKPRRFNIYFGGGNDYADKLDAERAAGFASFTKVESSLPVG